MLLRHAVKKVNFATQPFRFKEFGFNEHEAGDRYCVASQALILDSVIRSAGGEGVSENAKAAMIRELEVGLAELNPTWSQEAAHRACEQFLETVHRTTCGIFNNDPERGGSR